MRDKESYEHDIELLSKTPLFDREYYLTSNPDVAQTGMDPIVHYLSSGALEGRKPHPLFDTAFYLERYPGVARSRINPLVHFIQQGRSKGYTINEDGTLLGKLSDFIEDEGVEDATLSEELLAGIHVFFNESYYLSQNPVGIEEYPSPLVHFLATGWKKRLSPGPRFDTAYYLDHNPDVEASGYNPLLHFLRSGRDEGRFPFRPLRHEVPKIMRALWFPLSRPIPKESPRLALGKKIRQTLETNRTRLVLSLSHNSYTDHCGGIQLLITREQELFNSADAHYVHIAPVTDQNSLSPMTDSEEFLVHVTIDGEPLGCDTIDKVQTVIAGKSIPRNTFIVHSLINHNVQLLCNLFHSLENKKKAFFWLHDYFSICPNFSLMRNGITFCGGPSSDSQACSICSFGQVRDQHLDDLDFLFNTIPFTVVAPSQTALDFWTKKSSLSHKDCIVHPHGHLTWTEYPIRRSNSAKPPIRVAFCGYPLCHKGWHVYMELIDKIGSIDNKWEFYHFAEEPAGISKIHFRSVRVTPRDKEAMVRALTKEQIDIVIIPAQWPETFCYVAFEALAAGCVVITLECSGNVSALATGQERVFIVKDASELIEAFRNGTITTRIKTLRDESGKRLDFVHTGSTATISVMDE